MSIASWSTNAALNNSASPNGAPEGMAPSGVNDTIRQIMADVKTGVIPSVATVADLRNLVLTTATDISPYVYLAAHTTAGDGGHGVFRPVTGAAPSTYVDDNGTIIVPTGGNGSAAWLRINDGYISPQMFGAPGDGVTDDTVGMFAWITHANTAGGGHYHIPRTEAQYLIKWDYSIYGTAAVAFSGCTGLLVTSDGATLKIMDGAKNGNFSAVSKEEAYGIKLVGCVNSAIIGPLYIDGNKAGVDIGSDDGNGVGIGLYNLCDRISVENVHITGMATDGVYVGGATINKNIVLSNISSKSNRRQGMSLVHCTNVTVINCELADTGDGGLGVAPQSGIDFEPTSGVVENITLINPNIYNNVGHGMIAASGVANTKNVQVYGGVISGTSGGRAIQMNIPSFLIQGAEINGNILNLYGTIRDCIINHDGTYTGGYALESGIANQGCLVENTIINTSGNVRSYNFQGARGTNAEYKILRGCTLNHDGDSLTSATYLALHRGALMDDCIINHTGTAPASPYYISRTDGLIKDSVSTSANVTFYASGNSQVSSAQTVKRVGYISVDAGEAKLTISSGAISASHGYHTVDTEASASTDDLDTINGGYFGQRLILKAANGARTIVLKDGTGNIKLSGSVDFSLDNADDIVELFCDGTNWLQMSASNNGA